jgi:hypothetical protein
MSDSTETQWTADQLAEFVGSENKRETRRVMIVDGVMPAEPVSADERALWEEMAADG